MEEIPLVVNEIRRILKANGRVGIVSMSTVKDDEHPSLLENAYIWMHRHFPHLVDCQPIDAEARLRNAGFKIANSEEVKIWTMPVAVIVAEK